MPYQNYHETWTKLQEKYGVSKNIEDDFIPSTLPTCCMPQGNDKVSGDGKPNFDDPTSLSHCNGSSLDVNTSSTIKALHTCVDIPSISCGNQLFKYHDDMLSISCCHDMNASISSSCGVSNNVEEARDFMCQDKVLNEASSNSSSSSSSPGSHICLMARASKVTSTMEPNISHNDEDGDNVASLNKKGEMVLHAIHNNKIACSNFFEIMAFAIESKNLIEDHVETIYQMEGHAHDSADDIADLKEALEKEQTTKKSLEKTFALSIFVKGDQANFEIEPSFGVEATELTLT
jgi:hypothetical protein